MSPRRNLPPVLAPALSRASTRGAALVLVLAALALISFLAIVILTFAHTEGRSARASADIIEARLLATLPEKLVMAQLRQATSKLGTQFTWASQPGMITVFDTTDTPFQRHKLYSAARLVVPGGGKPDADAEAFKAWNARPNSYTDLNEPIAIVPRQRQGSQQDWTQGSFVYPILDPAANGLVDGFSAESKQAPGASLGHPMPMPAMWLYVLRDGTIVAPGSDDGQTTQVPGATEDNPIVGRIAYWTDDDSCKLNLNTATEPAPWLPVATRTVSDDASARSIPVKGEHYRVAAHPASTSLDPVFRSFGLRVGDKPPSSVSEPQDLLSSGSDWWSHLRDWHRPLPRTFNLNASVGVGTQGGTQANSSSLSEVETRQDRLFATVDELFYTPDRTPLSAKQTALKVRQEDLRRARFFLTPRSRAPELNPWNRPKISLWPLPPAGQRSELDKAIARACTVGGRTYAFQRQSVVAGSGPTSTQSGDADMQVAGNQELFGFLQTLTEEPVPGYDNAAFLTPADPTQGKYTEDSRDQLLAGMMDTIRSTVAPYSPSLGNSSGYHAVPASGQIGAGMAVPLRVQDQGQEIPASMLPPGYAGPTRWVKGQGRFPVLTEVAIVFSAIKAKPGTDGKLSSKDGTFADETTELAAFLVLEPFLVSPGQPAISPVYLQRVTLKDTVNEFLLDGVSLDLPGSSTNRVSFDPEHALPGAGGRTLGSGQTSGQNLAAQFLQANGLAKSPGVTNEDTEFPFVSQNPVKLQDGHGKAGQMLSFSGGTLILEIADDASGATVQLMEVTFPATSIPVPLLATTNESDVKDKTLADQFTLRFAPTQGRTAQDAPRLSHLVYRGDVVRSMQLATNDPRLAAARPALDAAWFRKVDGYDNTYSLGLGGADDTFYAHTLQDGTMPVTDQPGAWWAGQEWPPANAKPAPPWRSAGSLVARFNGTSPVTLPADDQSLPALMPGTFPVNSDIHAGDFTTAPGLHADGPLISLPDQTNPKGESTGVGGLWQRGGAFTEDDGSTFSPLRQAGSGFIFGTLPTAAYGTPWNATPGAWQTLLLCPNPASRTTTADNEPAWDPADPAKRDHFGFRKPRDHLWLENFWLPVTEPAGASDGFSTEGKVNMNYQILPFTWITRRTAMLGALRGVRMTAIPTAAAVQGAGGDHYKTTASQPSRLEFRYGVDAAKTLQAFDDRFNDGKLFRYPSEICDLFLVPERLSGHTYSSGTVNPPQPPASYKDMQTWWEGKNAGDPADGFEATGDNLREQPYAQLYPRLTTRSNTFTVHYRVQVLRKARSTRPDTWTEKDNVTAEYRGQTTVERTLDTTRSIPDFAQRHNPRQAVDDYVRIRVVSRRPFAP